MVTKPKEKKKSNWFVRQWYGELSYYESTLINGMLVPLVVMNGSIYLINGEVSDLVASNNQLIRSLSGFLSDYFFMDQMAAALFLQKYLVIDYYGVAAGALKLAILVGLLTWSSIGAWRASSNGSKKSNKAVVAIKKTGVIIITLVMILLFCCFSGHKDNLLLPVSEFITNLVAKILH